MDFGLLVGKIYSLTTSLWAFGHFKGHSSPSFDILKTYSLIEKQSTSQSIRNVEDSRSHAANAFSYMMHIQYEALLIPKNADLIKKKLFSIQLNTGEDVKTSLWSSQSLFTAPFTPQAFIVGVGFVLPFPGCLNSAV